MNLQTWAEWVAEIDAVTNGGTVELRAGAGTSLTVSVHWERDGQCMEYNHTLSMTEMRSMHKSVQRCVLDSIKNAVRKAVSNK